MRASSLALMIGLILTLSACGPQQSTSELSNALDVQVLPNWATEQETEIQSRALPPSPLVKAPPAGFRIVAEYEPTRAVVMTYAGYTTLLDQIAAMVADAGAEVWAVGGPENIPGVPADKYQRLSFGYNSVWSRDYGPVGIEETTGQMAVIDNVYRHYASRPGDDAIPCNIADHAGAACYASPLIMDGGNILTDSHGNLFMTTRTYVWNSSISESRVDQLLRENLGVQTIHKFDYARNGNSPADGTGHIDMFVKLLGDCTVLVSETSQAPFAEPLNAAADYFADLDCPAGQPYQVYRIPGWYSGGVWYTYTNSLIVNDTVLVPSYQSGNNSQARRIFEQAMPGYQVVMIDSDGPISSGGSIHCITKEIPAGGSTPSDWDVDQTAGDTPIGIPDNNSAGIRSQIQVSAGAIQQMEVDVDITHTWIGDLRVRLQCPSGTIAVLHDRTGSSADDIHQTYQVSACNGQSASGVFSLLVSDHASYDVGTLDRFRIKLKTGTPTNQPPLADAGPDQTVGPADTVQLDGSASMDPEGASLSYYWTQTQGPAVTLSDPYAVGPTFNAPDVDDQVTLTFSLTVSDGQLDSAADSVDVLVDPGSGGTIEIYSTDTPIDIPDNSGEIQSEIVVNATGYVASLEAEVNITHTYIGDLRVRLRCPSGSIATLHDRSGGSADDIHQIYQVTACNNQVAAGTYTLLVSDHAGQDVGTLDGWKLTMTVKEEGPGPGNGDKYALLIGVSNYKAISDLSYCDEDITDWYAYLTGKGYQIWVYGDTNQNTFPRYDGLATERNIRDAIGQVMSLADSDDIVALIFSGHGSGNGYGSSYYCAWDTASGEQGEDGAYYDTEMAADLQGYQAGKLFIFFDSCFSGGMGPELLGYGGEVYVTTTCTEDGYGYDEPQFQNGAWTHYYLEAGLIDHFQNQNVDTHECYTYADGQYGATGGDAPMEFDNISGAPFYLDFSRGRSLWQLTAERLARDARIYARVSLAGALEGASSLELSKANWSQGARLQSPRRAELGRSAEINGILEALEPGQLLLERAARCLFGYSLIFRDANGSSLGEVGICQGPSYGQDHEAVLVLDGRRYGMSVPNASTLVDRLDRQLRSSE